MTLTQPQCHAVLRVVLQTLERLNGEAAHGIKRFCRKMRSHNEIGKQRKRFHHAIANERCAEHDVN